jgi:hypothetical protein
VKDIRLGGLTPELSLAHPEHKLNGTCDGGVSHSTPINLKFFFIFIPFGSNIEGNLLTRVNLPID